MGLYAFDGTGQIDDELDLRDTNVVRFRDAYKGHKYYQTGVGTRLGLIGRIIGGITGAGGRTRVRESLSALDENMKKGDRIIDIIGFSRGAAIAVHFANQVCKLSGSPKIRFLGLFDTVPSFGVPGNPINLHWDLNCPENIEHCFHALALDERRFNFVPHRISSKKTDGSGEPIIVDVWFRGVHADIGGGNQNTGLSSIALNWMFQCAIRCGVDLDMDKVKKNAAMMKLDSAISIHKFDPIKQPFRPLSETDLLHSSVAFRADGSGREHNNPMLKLAVIDDAGKRIGLFDRTKGASA
jgi:uncharacterized protein (DUF2235 family)